MATYVLLHGGAHGGWCYRKVASFLRRPAESSARYDEAAKVPANLDL